MTMPMFNADASLYPARNVYRSTAAANSPRDEGLTVIPQSCGLFKGIFCGTVITAGSAACAALCIEGGPVPCAACWTTALGAIYQTCHDCIPGWMRALVDAAGGGGSGGSGGGGGGIRRCCPAGRECRCGGQCVTRIDGSVSCVGGLCLTPGQSCP
jgi:hypothetical protein